MTPTRSQTLTQAHPQEDASEPQVAAPTPLMVDIPLPTHVEMDEFLRNARIMRAQHIRDGVRWIFSASIRGLRGVAGAASKTEGAGATTPTA